jgi:nucleotide-binding universal stress UspA family protein
MTNTQATTAHKGETASAPHTVFGYILCAVDGTRRSYIAVEQAAALAGPTGQLTLLAVTAETGSGTHKFAAIGSARAKRLLERATRIAESAGVNSTEVVDPAGSKGASLIVMGSRRRAGLRALGSVSRRVVHDAHCSVLLVPPEDPPG